MAELFLAQQPPHEELLVIKRILPYLAEEPEFVQMFLDEARIAAQLHHPNLVQLFELGSLGESIFIAMEYLAGVDLRRILSEETKFNAAVPYAVAARICAQVAAGLDYAHMSTGVDGRPLELIHRDVSPQNVMVGYDGSVKLVDFGIAKAGAFMERSKPGVIKGKFLYLSPEQVAQERLDHRTDIFALGVMLYEITTGRSPFVRPTTEGILYAIRFENPSPPHLLRNDYPPELSRIVMRCLTKDRDARYQRAAEVQEELEYLLDSGALRQSDDVADYVARLLGEEEERTVLHIPVSKPQGDTRVSSPGGLTARPARRPSAEALPSVAVDDEPRTQMARPRELLAALPPFGGEEEEDEPTAIRTVPGRLGALPGGGGPLSRAPVLPPSPPEESTVDERPARPAASARRPTGSGRKASATPSPQPVVDRRRATPVFDEEASVTPATVSGRGPVRASPPGFDEDFQADAEDVEPSGLEPEDDESTAGFSNITQTDPGPAPRARGRGLLVALFVSLLLAVGGGAAWLFWLEPLLQPAAPPPATALVPEVPVAPGASADPVEQGDSEPSPGELPTPGTGAAEPAPEPGTAEASGAESGSGQEETAAGSAQEAAESGSAQVETAAGVAGAASAALLAAGAVEGQPGNGPSAAQVAEPPTPPTKIPVLFKAPSRTDIRVVGKRRVKANTSLSLPPGEKLRIRYRCPG
ncbi:MAG TPA: protein kinase, partial [Myxococcaceae bacterium]|nr:protein kinase [Myxococcaceae bacterium]